MKVKKPKKEAVNLVTKLTSVPVMEEAKAICDEKQYFLNEYITEAVKEKNLKHNK